MTRWVNQTGLAKTGRLERESHRNGHVTILASRKMYVQNTSEGLLVVELEFRSLIIR